MMASHHGASLRDPDRIQTCNLLIRSQMLYSVELRNRATALGGSWGSDSDRIQTCNLLIRSQMLYSVELRSLYVHPLRGVCECKGTFYFPFYQMFCCTSPSIPNKGDTRRTGTSLESPSPLVGLALPKRCVSLV